jgi:hypothetical protein
MSAQLAAAWDRVAVNAALEMVEWAQVFGVELPERLTLTAIVTEGRVGYTGIDTHEFAEPPR